MTQGDFHHPRHAESLAHQRETGAGGGGHCLPARKACADNRADGLDLRACLIDECSLAAQVLLHEYQDGRCRRDGVSNEEVKATGKRAESETLVALGDDLLVVGRIGGGQLAEREPAGTCRFTAKAEAHAVRRDNLGVIGATTRESLDVEVLKILLRPLNELRDCPEDDHVRRAGVARRLSKLLIGEGHDVHFGAVLIRNLENGGVVDEDAAIPQLSLVNLVGFPVERDEHIKRVAVAERRRHGNATLAPCRPAHDLGRERDEGHHVVSDLPGCCGESLGCGHHALSAFTRESDDKISCGCHSNSPLRPQVSAGYLRVTIACVATDLEPPAKHPPQTCPVHYGATTLSITNVWAAGAIARIIMERSPRGHRRRRSRLVYAGAEIGELLIGPEDVAGAVDDRSVAAVSRLRLIDDGAHGERVISARFFPESILCSALDAHGAIVADGT